MSNTHRRLLFIDSARQRFWLESLSSSALLQDSNLDADLLWGEALSQAILRKHPDALVIARGPLAFLAGNKATLGYVSPLTGLPHYSFVGGRSFAQLLNLGLDAVVFVGATRTADVLSRSYLTVSGRAPDLLVSWKPAENLPPGQRSAYYWLVQEELGGNPQAGSAFTLGTAALHGYRAANVAVDAIYHAGRGGAGHVFSRHARALVLKAPLMTMDSWLGPRADAVRALQRGEFAERLERYGDRLSRRDGGTVAKLYSTGSGPQPTLPSRNAQRVGYALADLGARKVLTATRTGQEGCHWCPVNCRHWHWVDVDYAPDHRDRYLDDFEPTYALYAMLDLQPSSDTLAGRLELLRAADQQLVVPIEQLGCDVIDVGVGIAALFEGLERGLVPQDAVPPSLRSGRYFGSLELASAVVAELSAGSGHPAVRALGNGPQGLVDLYPAMQACVFTSGPGTLANAGHANALWTFLMPFSRYFGHYVGQIYKVSGELTPAMGAAAIHKLFEHVVDEMLLREEFGCLGAALSACAFTSVVFSEDGEGTVLDHTDLLARTLAAYGFELRRTDLEWFAEAFWTQSLALKLDFGWRPPRAGDLPARVIEALSQVLHRPLDEIRELMDALIELWLRRASARLQKWGYDPSRLGQSPSPDSL